MKYILALLCVFWLLAPSSYEIKVDGPERTLDITTRVEVKVSAYNPGDPSQTDSSPCIGPRNKDICEAMATQRVCAANFVPLGTVITLVHKAGIIQCVVLDRMNPRYQYRVDLAMASKEEAVEWGLKSATLTMQ